MAKYELRFNQNQEKLIVMANHPHVEIATLFEHEKQMIHLICEAKSDHDISILMNMDLKAVEYCKRLIFQKTGTHNWAELVIYAIKKSIFKIRF